MTVVAEARGVGIFVTDRSRFQGVLGTEVPQRGPGADPRWVLEP